MEKSRGRMDVTDSSSGRERLGIRFTIDYLLFNKGSSTLTEESEAQSPTPDPMPHGIKGEQRQGTLSDRDSLELHGQEKEAEGSEEEHEEEPGKGEGREGDTSSENPQDKPTQSYIALISMAILASEEKKLLLCDIYQWIMDHYPYFKSKDKNWRNSVRHNLSLNECFVKAGRSDNGKGHFWAIHPANIQDFSKGDYQRRRAAEESAEQRDSFRTRWLLLTTPSTACGAHLSGASRKTIASPASQPGCGGTGPHCRLRVPHPSFLFFSNTLFTAILLVCILSLLLPALFA